MTDSDTKPPTFDDLALSPAVAKAVADRGYTEPTPVQLAAFDPACAGKDLVVQARTGTGKTAAFALPLVSARVREEPLAVQALVLCPTRELALQVNREVEALSTHTKLRTASVYGGASITKQFEELDAGAHIVVGTPGRVLDHLKRGTLNVSQLRSFVLDECDEMLSMGFLPQINEIWSKLPQGHQTLLFSATVPKDVTRIAETRLRSPEFITLSGDHIGALEIQHFVYLSHGRKLEELKQIIEVENPDSAIVFCNTRDETKRVAAHLQGLGYQADWLNADLGQSEREQVMRRTREGELKFLVCTDVAARGIDISHLTHVINYDFPDASEQYVHRTGRTGRAGNMGTAISLIPPTAIGDLYYLRLKYKIQPQERSLPTQLELQTRQHADVIASLSLRYAGFSPSDTYYQLARRLLASDSAEVVIAGLLQEQLGEADAAVDAATKVRRARVTRAKPPRAPNSRGQERESRRKSEDASGRQPDARKRSAPRAEGAREDSSREDYARRRGAVADRTETNRANADRTDAASAVDNTHDDDSGEGENRRRRRRSVSERNNGADTLRGARRARSGGQDEIIVDDEPEFRYEVSDAPAGAVTQSASRDDGQEFINLYVGVGKRDGARTQDLQQALEDAGIEQSDTGRILVKQRHSFVEVTPAAQQAVIDKLNGSTICGREALVEVARPR